MNCIHIVGNRPQFIKLALLHRALGSRTGIGQKIIHTGQHYDLSMSGTFFEEFALPAPAYQLKVNQLPGYAQIGQMVEQIGQILAAEKPQGVIVYGDTNTTLAGALAAAKNNIPLAHVEAGIRTYDDRMPEESNRFLTDRLAELNFCPTELCINNLEAEGFGKIPSRKIVNTGDIMLDAWKLAQQALPAQAAPPGLPEKGFVLATIHREENNASAENLSAILQGFNDIHQALPVVMPCHPKTKSRIMELGIPVSFDLRPPFSYGEMMAALNRAAYVVTDSGGFCREAYFSRKPTLVIMQHPFWPEIIREGACLPTAADRQQIRNNFAALRQQPLPTGSALFGDGNAATKMAAIIEQEWKK